MATLGKKLTTLSQLVQVANGGGREILKVALDEVTSEEQVRKKFTNLQELANSLKVEGQQSPVIVSPRNSEGKYVIQKGERRWRAAKLAGLETIDIIVNIKDQTPLDAIAGQLIENIQREELTAMEIAEALGVLSDGGMRGTDIAERIGKTSKYVSIHLALRNLSAPVQRLVDANIVGDVELLYTLEQIAKLDLKRCEAACKLAETTGITRKQAKELYQALKEKKAAEKTLQTEEAAKTKLAKQEHQNGNEAVVGAAAGTIAADTTSEASTRSTGNEPAVEPRANPADQASTSTVSRAKKQTKAPDNPFLTEEERELTAPSEQGRKAEEHEANAGSVVIKVQTTDSEAVQGQLLVHRPASTEAMGWIRTEDGQDIEVELQALKITGISATE